MKMTLLAIVTLCGAALAQPATTTSTPAGTTATPAGPVAPAAPAAPVWTDPEFSKIAALMAGSWKTTAPIKASDGSSVDMVMSIAPVTISGIPDAMYIETARSDAMHRPTREAVLQLYKYKGKVRLRTFDFLRVPDKFGSSTAGMWAAPEAFPTDLNRQNFVGTLDIDLAAKGKGYSGKTPYAYPTGLSGAVEMTSEIALTGDSITTADRGFDASGAQVWGPKSGETYTFAKFDPGVKVTRFEGGLVSLEYTSGSGEVEVQTGDRVAAHYVGWLSDGYKFDSSRDKSTDTRQEPLQFRQGGLIEGWNRGLLGAKVGTIRRLIIPSPLAYAERRRGMIPENANLYFETEILDISRPPAAVPANPNGEQPGQPPQGQPQGQPQQGGGDKPAEKPTEPPK